MSDAKLDLQSERDRYVGFAFAAADLLLEVAGDLTIMSVSGAPHSILGRRQSDLIRRDIRDLIAGADRPVVSRLLTRLEHSQGGGRLEPSTFHMTHSTGADIRVLLGACRLPSHRDRLFVTVASLVDRDTDGTAEPATRDIDTGLLQADDLLERAAEAPGGGGRRLVMLKVNGLTAATRKLPTERAKDLLLELGGTLRALSLGADNAGRLGEDEFGIIRGDTDLDTDAVAGEIGELARAAGVPDGTIHTKVTTVQLSQGDLGETGAARAVAYAVRNFTETRGLGLTVSALEQELPAAVDAAVGTLVTVQSIVTDSAFSLAYQPIVALNNREVHHYEALIRFPDKRSPFETIKFAEAVGLVEDLDLLVCRTAITELRRVPNSPGIAINVSGSSVASDAFRHRFIAELKSLTRAERRRLLFELTESSAIDKIEEASGFLKELKGLGHAICLDDFGAGASAYAYLRHFDIDIVKVDGPFLRAALEKDREKALIRSVCRLCRDLQCTVVGEMIEDERQAEAASRLGIDFGQGWLFGRPAAEIPAEPPKPRRR